MSNFFYRRFNRTLFIRYAWLFIYRLLSWPPNGWTSYFFFHFKGTMDGRRQKIVHFIVYFYFNQVYSHFGKQYLSVIQWALGASLRGAIGCVVVCFIVSFRVCGVWMSIADIRNKNQMKTCPMEYIPKSKMVYLTKVMNTYVAHVCVALWLTYCYFDGVFSPLFGLYSYYYCILALIS